VKSNTLSNIINNIKKMDGFDIIIVEGAHDKNIPKIRIGDIKERENTILTYNRDFDGLIEMIKNEFVGGKK